MISRKASANDKYISVLESLNKRESEKRVTLFNGKKMVLRGKMATDATKTCAIFSSPLDFTRINKKKEKKVVYKFLGETFGIQ